MATISTITQELGFGNLLDTTEATELKLIDKIREGVPFEVLTIFADQGLLAKEDIEKIVANPRTLARRKSKHEALNHEESDKFLRIVRICLLALQVFGSVEKTRTWFYLPNKALDNREPRNLLDTDFGVKMVEKVLNRIEYGVYS